MSTKRTFLRLLKSRRKKINKQKDNINKFKQYVEKEWLFLENYDLKLKYNSFNDAEFYSEDKRFYFVINYESKPKYNRQDSSGVYKSFKTNSKKEFIEDMLDFIDMEGDSK